MPPESQPSNTDPAQPELTLRALLLGAALSAVMAAANAYLGLFAGMTVSASIPAAVVSMLVLRAMGGGLLENNLVQTAASAGESVAAGAIFTLPALLMVGVWSGFGYFETLGLLAAGGTLGTIFTIPLRRVLVEQGDLPFPEGTATARVLRVGHGGGSAKSLGLAAGLAFAIKLLESAFGFVANQTAAVISVAGRSWVLGTALSPALFGVGAILGLRAAGYVFLGGIINWAFVIPFVAAPSSSPSDAAWLAWSEHTRFLGVGAMAAGGVLTLFEMRGPIAQAFIMLTERGRGRLGVDLSQRAILILGALSTAVVMGGTWASLGSAWLGLIVTSLVLSFGFLFCAVAAYMAGLVGSSNNPVSGVTLATLLLVSGLLVVLRPVLGVSIPVLEGAALLAGAAVCTALAIAGDTIQDLKAGSLLGARPRNQQIAQLLGVVCSALVLGPVLGLLESAYGFGVPTSAHPNPLRAPQATLMAAVVHGVFGGALPWNFVLPGVGIAVVLALLNGFLRRRGHPTVPSLAVAVGLYLPLELETAMVLGALAVRLSGTRGSSGTILVGAGLITGEALSGLLAAVTIVLGARLPLMSVGHMAEMVGIFVSALVLFLIFRSARSQAEQ